MSVCNRFLCILMLFGRLLPAQETPSLTPGNAMIESHLILETSLLSRRFLKGAQSREEWEQGRDELKRRYFDMLGLWPLPERTPLKATVTGTLDIDEIQVEKVHFQSRY